MERTVCSDDDGWYKDVHAMINRVMLALAGILQQGMKMIPWLSTETYCYSLMTAYVLYPCFDVCLHCKLSLVRQLYD